MVWESHALESVFYEEIWGEFVIATTLIGRGPDQEEFKYVSRNQPGHFLDTREYYLTIDGELQDDIELIKTLLKYDTSTLTTEEWAQILEHGDILDWT